VDTRAYRPARNIFGRLRDWPKTLADFSWREPRFTGISECPNRLAAEDPFQPVWIIITLTGVYIRVGPLNSVPVVPRHPIGCFVLQLHRVPLQLSQIIERIRTTQFTAVNQTHE
jgi:hypothetical protein